MVQSTKSQSQLRQRAKNAGCGFKVPFGKEHPPWVFIVALSENQRLGIPGASQTSHVIAWWKPPSSQKNYHGISANGPRVIIITTIGDVIFSCPTSTVTKRRELTFAEFRTENCVCLVTYTNGYKAPSWDQLSPEAPRSGKTFLMPVQGTPQWLEPNMLASVLRSCPCWAGKSLEEKAYPKRASLL